MVMGGSSVPGRELGDCPSVSQTYIWPCNMNDALVKLCIGRVGVNTCQVLISNARSDARWSCAHRSWVQVSRVLAECLGNTFVFTFGGVSIKG